MANSCTVALAKKINPNILPGLCQESAAKNVEMSSDP